MANLLDLYNTFSDGFGGVNKKLVYPLENQSDYLGKITFTPINEERVNMSEQSENLVTLLTEQVKEFGKLGALLSIIAAKTTSKVRARVMLNNMVTRKKLK